MLNRILATSFLFGALTTLSAQTLGDITGEVRDATGAIIAGVNITLTNPTERHIRGITTIVSWTAQRRVWCHFQN